MEKQIQKVAKNIESNNKIPTDDKLKLFYLYYETLSVVKENSYGNKESENIDLIGKIFEIVSDKSKNSKKESISSSSFFKYYLRIVEKAPLYINPIGLLQLNDLENGYKVFIKGCKEFDIIKVFSNLSYEQKADILIKCRDIYYNLLLKTIFGFGKEVGLYLTEELMDNACINLFLNLRNSTNNNENSSEMIANLDKNIIKFNKDYLITKLKSNPDILSNVTLHSYDEIDNDKKKYAAICTIYETTDYIDEEDSDIEFTKDCCNMLGVTEEQLKKDYYINDNVSILQYKKMLRRKKDEE